MRLQIGVIRRLVVPIRIDVFDLSHRIRPSAILRGNSCIPIPHLDGCCNNIAGAFCAVSCQYLLHGTIIQTQAVIVVRNGVIDFIAAFLVQLHGGAVLRQFLVFAGVSTGLIVNRRPVLFRAFHQVDVGAIRYAQGHNIQCIGIAIAVVFVNVRQRCLGFQQSAQLCRTQRSIFKSNEDILTGAVLIRVVQNFFGRLCKQPRTVFVLLPLHFVVQLSDKGIVFHIASPSALCRILSQKFRFSDSERLR